MTKPERPVSAERVGEFEATYVTDAQAKWQAIENIGIAFAVCGLIAVAILAMCGVFS